MQHAVINVVVLQVQMLQGLYVSQVSYAHVSYKIVLEIQVAAALQLHGQLPHGRVTQFAVL